MILAFDSDSFPLGIKSSSLWHASSVSNELMRHQGPPGPLPLARPGQALQLIRREPQQRVDEKNDVALESSGQCYRLFVKSFRLSIFIAQGRTRFCCSSHVWWP